MKNNYKKLLSALLVLTLATGCNKNNKESSSSNSNSQETSSQVSTWKCDECGHDGNTGKFCEECGTKKDASPSDTSSPVESSSSSESPSETSSESPSETTSESPSETESESPSETSSQESSPVVTDEEYVIMLMDNGHCTVSSDYIKATAGTIVTITVQVENGYELKSITVNGVSIDGSEFEMPNTSAIVEVQTEMVAKSEKYISGDVSANLVEEVPGSGLYVARNVRVNQESYVCFNINGKELSATDIDTYKSFANISLTTGHKGGFDVAGNAVYDFFYDANATNYSCYVQRVGVINLPSSADQIADLLYGKAMSRSTVYPSGLNKVNYTSSVTGQDYEWNLYKDGSYATAVDSKTKELQGIVYKKLGDDNYKVVNTYLEETYDENDRRVNYSDLATKVFSANYDIDPALKESTRYVFTPYDAASDATYYSHSVEALDMEMYNAYRSSYIGNIFNDVTVEGNTNVKSELVGTDGSFKTTVKTWFRWQNSSWYKEPSAFKTFEMEIVFDKRGAIVSGTYSAYTYTDKYYDFASKKLLAGYENQPADKIITFDYSYGNPIDEELSVDVSKYFVNDITTVNVKGKKGVKGFIDAYEQITCADTATAGEDGNYTIVFDFAPATALDAWQYGLIESKNPSVISNTYKGVGSGDGIVVIGSKLANGTYPTEEVKVSVQRNAIVRQFFIMTVGGYTPYYNDYDGAFVSDKGIVYANQEYKIQIVGSSSNGYITNNLGLSFTTSKDGLIDLSFDDETGILTINTAKAKDITEKVSLQITMESALQIEGWPKSTIGLSIMPQASWPTDLLGAWTSEIKDSNNVTFTSSTEGTITYNGTKYNFTYTYDASTGKISNTKLVGINNKTVSSYNYTLKMYIDDSDDALCVCLIEDASWGSDGADIIGYVSGDEYDTEYYYEGFTK